MVATGSDFVSDLSELQIIGKTDLPMLGLTYAKVNNEVAGTAAVQSAAFQTAAGGPPSQIAGLWSELRDELQNILGRTAENMNTAGQTILHIAEVYAATDHAAEEALKRAWEHGVPPLAVAGEQIPSETPPPVIIANP